MENKQTAVEWFFNKLENHEIQAKHYKLYQQAKQMEKEQIMNAYDKGCIGEQFELNCNQSKEQYYNETYGK
jgi:hypothetical protein